MVNHPDQWKGAGVAVPVFSLRSKRSVGVGEFRDIRALVDMCEVAGAVLPATWGVLRGFATA